MSVFTLAISCLAGKDHFQFALIHGPNIPGPYAILLFTELDFTPITSHIHKWELFLLWLHLFIFLELFLHWSQVIYWAPTDLGSSSFTFLSFYLFILFTDYNTSNKTCLAEQNIKYKHLPALQRQTYRSTEFDMCAEDKSPYPIWMNFFHQKQKETAKF